MIIDETTAFAASIYFAAAFALLIHYYASKRFMLLYSNKHERTSIAYLKLFLMTLVSISVFFFASMSIGSLVEGLDTPIIHVVIMILMALASVIMGVRHAMTQESTTYDIAKVSSISLFLILSPFVVIFL
jgi:hypothetical protein